MNKEYNSTIDVLKGLTIMDKNLQEIIRIREDRMIKAFNQNNMQITFVENFEQLYNIDGTGNRVAAMIYGPKEVIVVAGKNKVFETEAEAINHIKTISAPANAVRLNKKTPCAKTGECKNCLSADRICSSYVKLGYQVNADRIKVIIVNEDLGY